MLAYTDQVWIAILGRGVLLHSSSMVLCRSKVDGLRRERLLFDDVLRKGDRDWTAQRGEMGVLIRETTAAHEQRVKVAPYPDAAHPAHTTASLVKFPLSLICSI